MNEKEFLELFKISEGKYIIGIFQESITVYKQQMRALNIFHALVNQNIIHFGSDFSIAVVGGGIAGLTFAATALKANISVTLFEKEAEYLHMQAGCDTRKIHPNIYDWPDVGSTFPNARLPVLSWTHNTASNVAKQIIDGLDDISNQIDKSAHHQAPALFNPYKNSKIAGILDPTHKSHDKFTIVHNSPKISSYANLIVYAVGFGVEKELDESHAPSYWRNDALSQSVLTDKRSFLVSGVGDGALVDLCRIKVRHYSYERMLGVIKSDTRKYDALIFKLRDIKARGKASKPLSHDFYDTEFGLLEENYYRYIYEAIKNDIVQENTVIFNSRRTEEHALDFKKVSMLNAFMVYILKRYGHLEFRKGELTYKDKKYYLDGIEVKDVEQFVIRHGTDTSDVVAGMYLNHLEKNRLLELKALQKNVIQDENCWSFDSISRCFIEGSANPEFTVIPYIKRSEYVTPDTKAVCLSFVIILAKTISRLSRNPKHFRFSIHRVTQFDGQGFFQQITPYQGSKKTEDKGCFGNVYPINHGIVGQAITSGKPVLITNNDEDQFKRLSARLNLIKEHNQPVIPKSYLAIPVVAQVKSGQLATNLVFYMDTDEIDFFDRPEVFEIIVSALSGLVEYIEKMQEHHMITMSELEFLPTFITGFDPPDIVDNICFRDLDKSGPTYPSKANLKFKEFYSFDIIYNK